MRASQFIYGMGGIGDVVVAHDGRKCKPDMMFIYKDKKMVHNESRSCFIPQSRLYVTYLKYAFSITLFFHQKKLGNLK